MNAKRRFQRIPYSSEFFFLDQKRVHSSYTSNLSEGGFLLENIPILPHDLEVMFLTFIPVLELFSDRDWEDLLQIDKSLQVKSLRERGFFHLRKEDKEDVSTLFKRDIIVELDHVPDEISQLFNQNVVVFKKNIEFLIAHLNSNSFSHPEDRLIMNSCLNYLTLGELSIMEVEKKLTEIHQKLEW